MNQKAKNTKGITLIGLIVTIIVLLILAGVSLRIIAGEQGILNRVTGAVEKDKKATAKEQVELVVADYKLEYWDKKYTGEGEIENPKEYIQNKFEMGIVTENFYAKSTGENVKVYEGNKEEGKALIKGTIQEDGSIKWNEESAEDPFLEEANENPEKYRHPEQNIENNKTLGIGSNGEPINMDLWIFDDSIEYKDMEDGYTLTNQEYVGAGIFDIDCAYLGEDFEDIIIPKYIKAEGDEEFKKVVALGFTFYRCTSLTTAPEIPNSVTDMDSTFYRCTSLTTAPEIPNSVTDMDSTFYGCTSLTTAPEIPSSVTDIGSTFSNCTSLTTAPEIPNSVTDMGYTFSNCTSLTTAPEIPNSVTNMVKTFENCTSLTTTPEIPNSVTDMWGAFLGCTNLTGTIRINTSNCEIDRDGSYDIFNGIEKDLIVQVPANSEIYDRMISLYSSKENITIETF